MEVIAIQGNVIGREPGNGPGGGGWSMDNVAYTLNTIDRMVVCFGIGGYNSAGMLSPNPKAGIYEAQTSRTLDLNGGNPACNQGGYA